MHTRLNTQAITFGNSKKIKRTALALVLPVVYQAGRTNMCNLCLWEKYYIMTSTTIFQIQVLSSILLA